MVSQMESQSVYPILCFSKPEATNELIVQPRARGYGSPHPYIHQVPPSCQHSLVQREVWGPIQSPIIFSHEYCPRKEANGQPLHLHFQETKWNKGTFSKLSLLSTDARRVRRELQASQVFTMNQHTGLWGLLCYLTMSTTHVFLVVATAVFPFLSYYSCYVITESQQPDF